MVEEVRGGSLKMPLFVVLALPPLALYLLLVGAINLRRHPLLLSGTRDTGLLALGLCGFAVAGPLELFLPETAAFRFGPWVWILMLTLYFLLTSLVGIMATPRLVVYNSTVEELRPVISSIARELDTQSRWAGDSLALPQMGVRLHIEPTRRMRCVQLVATGSQQNYEGWRRFERQMRKALRGQDTDRNLKGLYAIVTSCLLLVLVVLAVVRDFEMLTASIQAMLRL
jgi:hypothetical protein